MSRRSRRLALRTTAAVAALACGGHAFAATAPTTTVSDVNMLNLLSPFLNLNATSTGRTTLSSNLSQSLATNLYASQHPTIAMTSISDKTIFSGPSTSITLYGSNAQSSYGPAANLAGGLPAQAIQNGTTPGTIVPSDPVAGLSSLGAAYQAAVSPGGANAAYPTVGSAQAVVTLLNSAYTFTSNDLGVAKFYFANGTTNGSTVATAPAGYTLPTANGLPNNTDSVYDLAYGVTKTGSGQDTYGDSRPVQVDPNGVVGYDPNALTGLATNPSFPSGHTTYAFTDSLLIGMLTPQFYQSMVLRASEYGNSRIDLGVHYALDIIASRSFVQYDLAQLLNGATGYTTTNTVGSTTAFNLVALINAAKPQLTAALGGAGAIATAAASNNANAAGSYNAYSLATYAGQANASNPSLPVATTNSQIYDYRMNYGLPTLSYTAAPQEQAPAGGPDASILLAPIYGGSTAAAQALAPGGGIYGQLQTSTINQIIVNTEAPALAAFYGTALSYWSRLDLYDAIGYFGGLTGTLTLAPTDRLLTNVTVASGGVLRGSGAIGTGAAAAVVEVQSGGVLSPGAAGATTGAQLTVNGALRFDGGSQLATTGYLSPSGATSTDAVAVNGNLTVASNAQVVLHGVYLPGVKYNLINVSGTITGAFNTTATTDPTGLMSLVSTPVQSGAGAISVTPQSDFASAAKTPNQAAVAAAIDGAGNAGGYGAKGAALLQTLIAGDTVASAPAAFEALSGEGLAGQEQTALVAGDTFTTTVLGQLTGWGGSGAPAPRQHLWASGFGQHASLGGEAATGSASLRSDSSGFAGGVDADTGYVRLGVAGGFSHSTFDVGARNTSGSIDGYHLGVYAQGHYQRFYLAGAFVYSDFDNSTARQVIGVGPAERENGDFRADEYLGRIEGGWRYTLGPVALTPFVGGQVASLRNKGFSEGDSGLFSLNVAARTIDSDKSFLGGQVDGQTVLAGLTLSGFARLSWDHDFDTRRDIDVSLASLPASFVEDGASAASDVAHVVVGSNLSVNTWLSVFAAFDGQFGDRESDYSGHGGVRIRW